MSPFLEAPVKSTIAENLLKVVSIIPEDDWREYHGFKSMAVPVEYLLVDPFLAALYKKRKFFGGVLKVDANSCYDWHTDTKRKVSVNMLLSGPNSHCLFRDKKEMYGPVVELKYAPDTYYVFDTQTEHMVVNLGGPRYLFSLEFIEEDENLTFSELCADLEGLNYGS